MMPPQSPTTSRSATKKLARARVLGVPPEEFGIERGARSIQDSNYCFHDVVTKTQADLIDEGYDETRSSRCPTIPAEPRSRRLREIRCRSTTIQAPARSTSRPRVKITEHYLRIDYEGTGRPCLYQIVTGGDRGEILRKKGKDKKPAVIKFDRMPFAGATPVPVAHRFFGRSIADQTMDIQRIKTAILRGVLDNSYMVNSPRVEVPESHAGPTRLTICWSRAQRDRSHQAAGGLNALRPPGRPVSAAGHGLHGHGP
jgi:hypothetical protein